MLTNLALIVFKHTGAMRFERIANETLEVVSKFLIEHCLAMVPEKMETVILF